MKFVFLTVFLTISGYFIWRDRHNQLWDAVVGVYLTKRRRTPGSIADSVRLLSTSTEEKTWLNGLHIVNDKNGIYIGQPILLWYMRSAFVPWSDIELMPDRHLGLGKKLILRISSINIDIAIPQKYRGDVGAMLKPENRSAERAAKLPVT